MYQEEVRCRHGHRALWVVLIRKDADVGDAAPVSGELCASEDVLWAGAPQVLHCDVDRLGHRGQKWQNGSTLF